MQNLASFGRALVAVSFTGSSTCLVYPNRCPPENKPSRASSGCSLAESEIRYLFFGGTMDHTVAYVRLYQA